MYAISVAISEIAKLFAGIGSGLASGGFSYEPKMPECLKK